MHVDISPTTAAVGYLGIPWKEDCRAATAETVRAVGFCAVEKKGTVDEFIGFLEIGMSQTSWGIS